MSVVAVLMFVAFVQTLMNVTPTMVAVNKNVLILSTHLCASVEADMYSQTMEGNAMVRFYTCTHMYEKSHNMGVVHIFPVA